MEDYDIIVDNRELKSEAVKELFRNNIKIVNKQLEIGDFILNNEIVCERKHVDDFVNSILDGRLFQQAKELARIPKKLLIIEGEQDIYSVRNVHANAIKGAIASIALDFKIPLLFTKDGKDTAQLFYTIIKRYEKTKNDAQLRKTSAMSDKDELEYIISSIPNVGRRTAQNLLKKFRTIRNIVNAEEKELSETEGVGKITAKKIRETTERRYE